MPLVPGCYWASWPNPLSLCTRATTFVILSSPRKTRKVDEDEDEVSWLLKKKQAASIVPPWVAPRWAAVRLSVAKKIEDDIVNFMVSLETI